MSRIDAGSLPISLNLATISRADLLFLDLLGQEPLQLGDGGERLLLEGDFVERVDLLADQLLLRQRPLEDVGERGERPGAVPPSGLSSDLRIAREDEVEQLHRVHVLFLALQPQPARCAGELLRSHHADMAR